MTKHEGEAIAYYVAASVLQISIEGSEFRESLLRFGFEKRDITTILAKVPDVIAHLEDVANKMAPDIYPMRVKEGKEQE